METLCTTTQEIVDFDFLKIQILKETKENISKHEAKQSQRNK